MQIVDTRLVIEPDICLVSVAAPEVIGSLLPAVQDRFVLTLVIRSAQREGVLGPNHESRPLAARIQPGFLQGVQLR